jgi:hypothetical protein
MPCWVTDREMPSADTCSAAACASGEKQLGFSCRQPDVPVPCRHDVERLGHHRETEAELAVVVHGSSRLLVVVHAEAFGDEPGGPCGDDDIGWPRDLGDDGLELDGRGRAAGQRGDLKLQPGMQQADPLQMTRPLPGHPPQAQCPPGCSAAARSRSAARTRERLWARAPGMRAARRTGHATAGASPPRVHPGSALRPTGRHHAVLLSPHQNGHWR